MPRWKTLSGVRITKPHGPKESQDCRSDDATAQLDGRRREELSLDEAERFGCNSHP